jgi:hypothetical protein
VQLLPQNIRGKVILTNPNPNTALIKNIVKIIFSYEFKLHDWNLKKQNLCYKVQESNTGSVVKIM